MSVCLSWRHSDIETQKPSVKERRSSSHTCATYIDIYMCVAYMHVMYIGVICIELYINAGIVLVPVLCID